MAVASDRRDQELLRAGLERWIRIAKDSRDAVVAPLTAPEAGLSSDTYFASVRTGGTDRELVVRLPPAGEGLFPAYDLAGQVRVQNEVADLGVAAVRAEWVDDPSWLGSAFMVMPRIAGHTVARTWPTTGWLAGASPAVRTRVFTSLVDEFACLHRVTADRVTVDRVDGRAAATAAASYLEWAGGDRPLPEFMLAARDWCLTRVPAPRTGGSVLWGDVQVTNAVFDATGAAIALLDWELAGTGAPEQDLGWFLALHEMTIAHHGSTPAGVPRRAELIGRYEQGLGRAVADLRWYEALAILRSGSIMVRMARLLAAQGVDDGWLITHNPTAAAFDRVVQRDD